MGTEIENQELDLVRLVAILFQLLKRKFFLILSFTVAGFLSGLILSHTGKKPGKDFYQQQFLMNAACSLEYLYDVAQSVAASLTNEPSGTLQSIRSIEPKLILNARKESRLVVTISAFDTAAIQQVFSLFKKELNQHQGLRNEQERQKLLKLAFLENVKLMADSVCRDGKSTTEHCLALLQQQAALHAELQNQTLTAFNLIDVKPVFVSQRNERNLMMAGLSFIGFLAGLLVSFLTACCKTARKMPR
jgi:hypothetical protein